MNDDEETIDHWHGMDLVPEDAVSPEPDNITDTVLESGEDVPAESVSEPEPVFERDPEPEPVLDPVPVAPLSPSEPSVEEDEEPVDRETLRRMAGILRKQRHNEITHQRAMEMLEADKELLEKFKNMKTWH
jgi:hypothetical protein